MIQTKGITCVSFIDSISINNSRLTLFLSDKKVVHLKLKYRHGQIQAKHARTVFILKLDTVCNNAQADSLAREMQGLQQNYSYSERLHEPIGYVLYDSNSHLYFANSIRQNNLQQEEINKGYVFDGLCYRTKEKRFLYITVVRTNINSSS